MDTEYSRLKERMENMNHMLDDIQVTICVPKFDTLAEWISIRLAAKEHFGEIWNFNKIIFNFVKFRGIKILYNIFAKFCRNSRQILRKFPLTTAD